MTVKQLINKGLITVYVPLASFVLGCAFISSWYATRVLKSDHSEIILILTTIIATIIGWFWWSYKIVKWKCWAFSKVTFEQDGYELYMRAIETGLIWPTGHVFNKTEIWTTADLENWSKIDPEIQELFIHKTS